MKHLKVLGLAAIAAGSLMAFLGASTASATVLCEKTTTEGAHCITKVAANTPLDFSLHLGTSSLMKGPFGETIATCSESTVNLLTQNGGSTAETVRASGFVLTMAKCNHPVTVITNGSWEVHHIAGTYNGVVTSVGTQIIIDETLFGSCQYLTSWTTMGTLTDSAFSFGPTFDINAKVNSTNGCPTMTWSGNYTFTGATNFSVSAG